MVDDLRSRLAAKGRRPSDVQYFARRNYVIGSTEAEARRKDARTQELLSSETTLAFSSSTMGVDLATVELDAPVGDFQTNALQGQFRALAEAAPDRRWTFRDVVTYVTRNRFVGTPEQAADELGDWRAAGINGINVTLMAKKKDLSSGKAENTLLLIHRLTNAGGGAAMPEIGVYEAMSTLRAVRRLRPDPIPDDVLRRVLEAATWAPTGGNRQPWRIIAVKDSARKERLGVLYRDVWEAFSKPYAAGLAKLPDDVREKQKRMIRAGDYLARNFEQSPVICIFCFNPEGMAITDAQLERPSVVGGGSVYPSVENLLLACRAEGLGCTLTTLLCMREPAVKELLNIPDGWGTAAAIPIGYPIHRGHGPISRRPIEELAFTDAWGEPLG